LHIDYAAIEKHQVVKSEQSLNNEENNGRKRGMVLPFEPHCITFDEVTYSVDMPQVIILYIQMEKLVLNSQFFIVKYKFYKSFAL
jgi:hypothetical protein